MRLFHPTARLCRELTRVLPERPFSIEFWDGGRVPATEPQTPTFFVRRASAIAHALRAPGPLGLGRAYVEGSLETDDIDGAFLVVDDWVPPPIAPRDKARLLGALALAAVPAGIPRRPSTELLLPGALHSPERDAQAIRYHYDVGNDFFALFLDESMTYSCAIFSRGATTLEEAQRTKLDLVATKLDLKPGMKVLDVGCGWGAFAIHAAREYGVEVTGITLSEPQAEMARERVEQAGLTDKIEIRVQDYRRLSPSSYDAIASIGMSEHVGDKQVDVYAKTLFDLLKPGGTLLNHAIAALDPGATPLEDLFSTRYVFPDGERAFARRTWRASARTTPKRCATGRGAWTSTSTGPRSWPEWSARACGVSTCAPPGTASRRASPPSTRSARAGRSERAFAHARSHDG
jgi:cyclopropane-fatty-acyl-phospholipid synthase